MEKTKEKRNEENGSRKKDASDEEETNEPVILEQRHSP